MAYVRTTVSALAAMADAIREKTGISGSLVYPEGYISGIQSISLTSEDNEMLIHFAAKDLVSYENSTVTKIRPMCFAEWSSLQAVSFEQCSYIGEEAFRECSNLTSISFPECQIIDANAFDSCGNLTTASFSKCTAIGSGAFQNNSCLISISFPSCSIVYDVAFSGCSSLSYGYFMNCSVIGSGAFAGCSQLSQITINLSRVLAVHDQAFRTCTILSLSTESTLRMSRCSHVGNSAFEGCESLYGCALSGCLSIGSNAFANCVNISAFNASQCSYVGDSAFYGCSSLTAISLAACTSFGGNRVFQLCDMLRTVRLTALPHLLEETFKARCLREGYYDDNHIWVSAVYGFSNLTTVYLDNCKTIRYDAFNNCRALRTISAPLCEKIDASAFYMCALTSAYFPACSSVGTGAFKFCDKLRTIDMSICEYIGDGAFSAYETGAINSVNLPLCRYIGNDAFNLQSRITEFNLPECEYVGDNAFAYTYKLSSISLPKCRELGAAFFDCSSLTAISLPMCSRIFGHGFFTYCENLTSIYLMSESMAAFDQLPESEASYASRLLVGATLASVFVPSSLVNAYRSAYRWSYISSRIIGI